MQWRLSRAAASNHRGSRPRLHLPWHCGLFDTTSPLVLPPPLGVFALKKSHHSGHADKPRGTRYVSVTFCSLNNRILLFSGSWDDQPELTGPIQFSCFFFCLLNWTKWYSVCCLIMILLYFGAIILENPSLSSSHVERKWAINSC